MPTLFRYPRGGAETIRGHIDFVNDDIVLIPVRSSYSFTAADEFIDDLSLSDIDDAARTSLTGNAVSDAAAFTANDVSVTAPASGNAISGFILAADTGDDTTSPLIAFYDHEATLFPANGAGHTISWTGNILEIPTQSGDTRIYSRWLAECMRGNLELDTADIRCILLDEGTYTFSQAHEDLADISGQVGPAVALTSEAVADDGDFTSDPVVFSSLSGSSVEACDLYFHTGTPGTSWLISYHSNAGIEVTPNGEDLTVTPTAPGWLQITTGA